MIAASFVLHGCIRIAERHGCLSGDGVRSILVLERNAVRSFLTVYLSFKCD